MARSAEHIADSTHRATYQDVLDAPAHRVAEIVGGTLYTHPRPAPPHALASSSRQGDLSSAFQLGRGGPGGWWIIFEPELHLGEDIVVPDLAGWRRERMPELPDTAYFTEDLYLAEQRLLENQAGRSRTYTLEEVERELGLAD